VIDQAVAKSNDSVFEFGCDIMDDFARAAGVKKVMVEG
jgi:hypothetical protein